MSIYDADREVVHKSSLICEGMTLTGNVESDYDLVVEGTIKGNVTCHDLVIRETGFVTGDIKAVSVSLYSSLNGNIVSERNVTVFSNAEVTGNIKAESLICEGVVNGNVECDTLLQLKNNSIIKGDCTSERFSVDETVIINGMITTKTKKVIEEVKETVEITTDNADIVLDEVLDNFQ